MNERKLGYLLLSLAMCTVGTTVIASKLISGNIPAVAATALRFAFALPVLFAIYYFGGERIPALPRKTWLLLVLQAGAGSVGYTILLISGLTFIPASDAGVALGTLPAVSALFSVFVLGERPSRRVLVAVGLATAGVMIVAGASEAPHSALGLILVLGAVLCESTFILLQKRMTQPLPPTMQAFLMTGFGFLLTLPAVVLAPPSFPLPQSALLAVLWYALVPTVGGFLLWYAGAARVRGAEAAVFTAVAPITAVVLATLFLKEPFGLPQIGGLISVALAILILSRTERAAKNVAGEKSDVT